MWDVFERYSLVDYEREAKETRNSRAVSGRSTLQIRLQLGKIVPFDVVALDYELTSAVMTEICSAINIIPPQKLEIHKLYIYSKETEGENGYM